MIPSAAVFADLAAPQDLTFYLQLRSAGYKWVTRYIDPPDAQYNWKRLSRAEADAIKAAGLGLALNWETSAAGAHDTQQHGHDHGSYALQVAAGYPEAGQRIWVSDDTNSTFAQVVPYYDGWASAVNPTRLGYYGSLPIGLELLAQGIVTGVWVSAAASQSGFSNWNTLRAALDSRVHAIQHVDKPLGFANVIDHNEALRADFLGGGPEVLDPTDPIVKAIQGRLDDMWSAIYNFGHASGLATINAEEQSELALLKQLQTAVAQLTQAANPNAPTDVQALANALAPLIAPAEQQAVADALKNLTLKAT